MAKSRVAVIKTSDRAEGVRRAVALLGINPVQGKSVLLKPNFNTADPYPGSTHNETLKALVLELKRMGAGPITIGDRSGPADTQEVMEEKGIPALCQELGVGLINFEDLPDSGWAHYNPAGSHWRKGFMMAKPLTEAECVVCTCCLKTHGFGGVFTISLKLGIGAVHKKDMSELHTSFRSMRKMIAEVNTAYAPALILLDAMEAFTDGGPMTGKRKRADLILASTDRIAIDAAGLAVLKHLGSNKAIMETPIFEQEQIARAVELGLGARGPEDMELVSDDADGNQMAARLSAILGYG